MNTDLTGAFGQFQYPTPPEQVPLRMQSTAVNLLPTLNQLGRQGTR